MDRRTFLKTATAAAIVPALPLPAQPVSGIDFATGPDQTVLRLVGFKNGLIDEVYRVTGVPRYQMGRDTWTDQILSGTAELVKTVDD